MRFLSSALSLVTIAACLDLGWNIAEMFDGHAPSPLVFSSMILGGLFLVARVVTRDGGAP